MNKVKQDNFVLCCLFTNINFSILQLLPVVAGCIHDELLWKSHQENQSPSLCNFLTFNDVTASTGFQGSQAKSTQVQRAGDSPLKFSYMVLLNLKIVLLPYLTIF